MKSYQVSKYRRINNNNKNNEKQDYFEIIVCMKREICSLFAAIV